MGMNCGVRKEPATNYNNLCVCVTSTTLEMKYTIVWHCCHVQMFKAASRNQSADIDLQNVFTALLNFDGLVLYVRQVAF